MHVFKHPKYYKELRERNRELRASTASPSVPQSDQAISARETGDRERAPGQGHKRQAASVKPQAAAGGKPQAASLEKQASSPEEQASSRKP